MTDNIPHGLEGYRRWKCTCPTCKAANAQYSREVRARAKKAMKTAEAGPGEVDNVRPLRGRRKTAAPKVKAVRPVPTPEPQDDPEPDEPTEPGMVELGVIAACENSQIAADRPDLVAMARRLAIFMDNPKLQKDYPSAARNLGNVMEKLCPPTKTKSKGRLVAIQKMTNRVQAPKVSRDA